MIARSVFMQFDWRYNLNGSDETIRDLNLKSLRKGDFDGDKLESIARLQFKTKQAQQSKTTRVSM